MSWYDNGTESSNVPSGVAICSPPDLPMARPSAPSYARRMSDGDAPGCTWNSYFRTPDCSFRRMSMFGHRSGYTTSRYCAMSVCHPLGSVPRRSLITPGARSAPCGSTFGSPPTNFRASASPRGVCPAVDFSAVDFLANDNITSLGVMKKL